MCTAPFLDFLLPVAIVAITVAICYFGIVGILPMRGSYLVLVCLTGISQPLRLFSRLLFVCLFNMRASQKASRTALMFLNYNLSEHSGLMYLSSRLGSKISPVSGFPLSSVWVPSQKSGFPLLICTTVESMINSVPSHCPSPY